MPPKKGKKGKGKTGKGKGKGKGSAKKDEGKETPDPKIKETILQEELDAVTQEVEAAKERVERLKEQNEFLQQEAYKVRVESHEYMSYMEKKTSKRQTTIISLSDQNQKEIQDLNDEKEQMIAEYEERKAVLKALLLEKEHTMAKTKRELENLEEYKILQADQLARIKELEKEVVTMRYKHSDSITQLKAQFLQDKKAYQLESEAKVAAMAKQANQEAQHCLNEHTQQIKQENRRLRHRLLLLIQKTRALHEHKRDLEAQKHNLLLEQQYARDLKTLRSARQHQVLKSFGLLDQQPPDDPT